MPKPILISPLFQHNCYLNDLLYEPQNIFRAKSTQVNKKKKTIIKMQIYVDFVVLEMFCSFLPFFHFLFGCAYLSGSKVVHFYIASSTTKQFKKCVKTLFVKPCGMHSAATAATKQQASSITC